MLQCSACIWLLFDIKSKLSYIVIDRISIQELRIYARQKSIGLMSLNCVLLLFLWLLVNIFMLMMLHMYISDN